MRLRTQVLQGGVSLETRPLLSPAAAADQEGKGQG